MLKNLLTNFVGKKVKYTKAIVGISLYSLTQLAKMLCVHYYVYVFSSTKSVTRENRFCLKLKAGAGWGGGRRTGWRNDPNNVCTCE
jgi:hypothetical protein